MGEIVKRLEPVEGVSHDTERAPAPDWEQWEAEDGDGSSVPPSGWQSVRLDTVVDEDDAGVDNDPTEPFMRSPVASPASEGSRGAGTGALGIQQHRSVQPDVGAGAANLRPGDS